MIQALGMLMLRFALFSRGKNKTKIILKIMFYLFLLGIMVCFCYNLKDAFSELFTIIYNALIYTVATYQAVSVAMGTILITFVCNAVLKYHEIKNSRINKILEKKMNIYGSLTKNILEFYKLHDESKEKNKKSFKEYLLKDNPEFSLYSSHDVIMALENYISFINCIDFTDKKNNLLVDWNKKLTGLINAMRMDIKSKPYRKWVFIPDYNFSILLNDFQYELHAFDYITNDNLEPIDYYKHKYHD